MRTTTRLLSDVKITDLASLTRAIEVIHTTYHVPHIVLTSVSLANIETPDPSSSSSTSSSTERTRTLSVIGSTMTSTHQPRAFTIRFPAIDAYFSGTGDMFAALMVVRMREAVFSSSSSSSSAAAEPALGERAAWRSDDSVDALDLPLARAAEKVLASMHEVLGATGERMKADVRRAEAEFGTGDEKRLHLAKSKAAELRLVRHVDSLREPKVVFMAEKL